MHKGQKLDNMRKRGRYVREEDSNNEDIAQMGHRARIESSFVENFNAMKDNNLSVSTKGLYKSKINGFKAFLQTLDPYDVQWYTDGNERREKFISEEGKSLY